MDEQTAFLRTLADQMRGTADTLERIGTRLRAGPDPEPGPPPPPPPVDTGRPIWEQMSPPTVEIPAEVLAPAGQNVVWIPVTLEHTRMATVLMRTTRAINASPATINVGANGAAYLSPDLYRWSPGDDRTHYVRLAFPAPAYRDGQRLRIEMTLTGVDPRHRSRMVTVTFREGAAFPAMPAQRHRPARRLDLGAATRRGGFDPATLRATDSGFLADGTPTWRARPAQGHAPGGQGETGLYLTEEAFPGRARTPVTHDAAERALRLHAARLPEGREVTHQGRAYRHQAAMIQGQTLDALCGSEGVWRMVARMPAKRFTWPGFRLVGRGPLGRAGGPGVWPPQIDIMHQPDLTHATQPITGFDLHWGQQYGEVGSGQRRGTLGAAARMDELAGATQRLDAAYHSYACAVVWTGEDAEVTFFFDDREIGCARLFARHQDMRSRVEFAPVAQVAVRAPATATAADWEADGGSADMLIRDIAHYPSGFALV